MSLEKREEFILNCDSQIRMMDMDMEVFHSHSSTSIQIADRFIAAQRKITVHKFVNECVAPLARTKASPSEVRLAASSSKMMARRDARIKIKGGTSFKKIFLRLRVRYR